jgi:hypothetical protein
VLLLEVEFALVLFGHAAALAERLLALAVEPQHPHLLFALVALGLILGLRIIRSFQLIPYFPAIVSPKLSAAPSPPDNSL